MTRTDAPATGEKTRRRLRALAHRWPTAVGAAFGLELLLDGVGAETTRSYAELLMIMPLLYVVLAVLRRRAASWPVLGVLGVLLVAVRLQDAVEPVAVLLAVALAAVVWGAVQGRHRDPDFRLQVAGMAGFAAVVLAATAVDPALGHWIVAAGLAGHGVWDLVHLRRDRTVARSYAEWCGAFDIAVAVALVVVPLL